jgi:hypothetical protein
MLDPAPDWRSARPPPVPEMVNEPPSPLLICCFPDSESMKINHLILILLVSARHTGSAAGAQ